jgi:hypothetical protein
LSLPEEVRYVWQRSWGSKYDVSAMFFLRAASLTAVRTTIRVAIGRAGAAVVFNGGKEHS